MKIRWLLFLGFFCWIPLLVSGQTAADLRVQLRSQKPDTHRVSLLTDLAWEVNGDDPDTAKVLLNEAVQLARKLQFPIGESAALNGLGVVADMESHPQLAFDYFRQALEIRKKVGDKKLIAASYINIGGLLGSMNRSFAAMDSLDEGIRLLRDMKDSTRLARALVNIAGVYQERGLYLPSNAYLLEARYTFEVKRDSASLVKVYNQLGHVWYENEKFDQALTMYSLAHEVAKKIKDEDNIASTLMNIGNVYDEWGNQGDNPDTIRMAIQYYEQALQRYQELDDSLGMASVFNNLGDNFKHSGQYDKGLQYLQQALAIRQRFEATDGIMEVINGFGDIYFRKKQYAKALKLTEEYYQIALSLNDEKFIQKAYKDFSRIYAVLGQFEKAYDFRKKYDELRYRRLDENRAHEFNSREKKYEVQKRDEELRQKELYLANQSAEIARNRATRNGLIGGGVALALITLLVYTRSRQRARSNKQLAAKNAAIERERKRADELLTNILPESTAAELKINNFVKPVRYESVTVVFTDFKGFTKIAETVTPEMLIEELDQCFRMFDDIVERHGLEKIKTIGDAYMFAGGLPIENDTHAFDALAAAVEMQLGLKALMAQKAIEGKPQFEMRIGIHTGPVVAGVVGSRKFAYDIWGDTVNIAARIEQASEPTKINISADTYAIIKDKYPCLQRGHVEAKNKGLIEMYFVDYAPVQRGSVKI